MQSIKPGAKTHKHEYLYMLLSNTVYIKTAYIMKCSDHYHWYDVVVLNIWSVKIPLLSYNHF